MSDGKKQHDWDLHSHVAFWATMPYQKKTFDIFEIHPGYTQERKKPKTLKEHGDRAKERFKQLRG